MNKAEDAPGWRNTVADNNNNNEEEEVGPLCYKCKGEKLVWKGIKINKLRGMDDDDEEMNKLMKQALASDAREDEFEGRWKKPAKGKVVVKITCRVCHGRGRMVKRMRQMRNQENPGLGPRNKRPVPEGWIVPGPKCEAVGTAAKGEELSFLVGHWRIFQRVGCHRWSTDDLCTAWVAGKVGRDLETGVTHYLDLGCGIGSVLLMVAWQFESAKCVGIEAQKLSFEMAKRSIIYNLGENQNRCSVKFGDIQKVDARTGENDPLFDLVTGTPPYFKVDFLANGQACSGYGGMPTCEQSAPARYEFRGGIEAYCQAASKAMAPHGRFVVVEGCLERNRQRVRDAAEQSGLRILSRLDVLGREDKPPLFAVYVMKHKQHPEGEGEDEDPKITPDTLIVRHKGGRRSDEYIDLMKSMGISPPVENENTKLIAWKGDVEASNSSC